MSTVAPNAPSANSSVELVPEHIELPPPPRVKRRRIVGLLLGPAALWLFPKTTGPHLAQAPLWKGIVAFFLSVIGMYAVIIVAEARDSDMITESRQFLVWTTIVEHSAPPDLVTRCRLLIADRALEWARYGQFQTLFTLGPGAFVIGAGVIFVMSLALLAWMPAGDPLRAVFGRSFRLSCWLISLAIPIAALRCFVRPLFAHWFEGINESDDSYGVVTLISMLFVLWVALRAGLRYAGPPVGPGFEPVEPRCWSCGYALHALPVAGRCPECGEPIADSLRRYAGRDTPRRNIVRRALAYAADVLRTILTPKKMFRSLRVHFDTPRARRVWAANLSLISLCAAAYTLYETWNAHERMDWLVYTEQLIPLLIVTAGSQALVGFICVMGVRLRAGGKSADPRVSTVALGFATSAMWPAAVWMFASAILMEQLEQLSFFRRSFEIASLDRWVTFSEVGWLLIALVQIVLLLWWGLTIDRAYRNLRYA